MPFIITLLKQSAIATWIPKYIDNNGTKLMITIIIIILIIIITIIMIMIMIIIIIIIYISKALKL